MMFAHPIWLWGLTGLLIPIGIHLLSRKEGKVVRMGSIRYLEDSTTKQFRSLRLNEVLLLVLRCLAIALLVFLLSGLQFNTSGSHQKKWLVVEAGLENDARFSSLSDSLKKEGYELKQLAKGFPALDSAKTERLDYWSTVDLLKRKSLQQVVILSYNYISGFKGKRITLPTNIRWITATPEPTEFPLQAIRLTGDSISVRKGISTPRETRFETAKAITSPGGYFHMGNDSVRINSPDTVSLAIVGDDAFAYDQMILTASLEALKESLPTYIHWKKYKRENISEASKADWLVWLSLEKIPEGLTDRQIILKPEAAESGPLLLQQPGKEGSETWLITKRLNEEIALQEKLPWQLANVILTKPEIDSKFDRRTQPEITQWSTETTTDGLRAEASAGQKDPSPLLAFAFMVVLLSERLVAFKRNQ
ncbi:MAG TPA: BatA domain-containing protein [Chryseolinea sp.]